MKFILAGLALLILIGGQAAYPSTLTLTTDKSSYAPGQTINFSGTATAPKVGFFCMVVYLYQGVHYIAYAMVPRQACSTGSYAWSIVVPTWAKAGTDRLVAEGNVGSASIAVTIT